MDRHTGVPDEERETQAQQLGAKGRLAAGQAHDLDNPLQVLLVEDDEGVRQTLAEVLETLGCAVRAVGSGEDALAEDRRSPCDVLVTDYLLPGISGLELAGLLRSQRPALRVVLISGYAEEGALRRIVGEGGVRFLRKPCSVAELAEAVDGTAPAADDAG